MTTPFFAIAVPSKIFALPVPELCPPPWNHTITGRRSPTRAAVHRFSVRQSSLRGSSPRA